MALRTIQTNFSTGEIDPAMLMRPESGAYQNGLKRARNIALMNTGGGEARDGFLTMAQVTAPGRVITFEFNTRERYMFVLQDEAIEFFRVMEDFSVVDLGRQTGKIWTEDVIWEITFAQLGDIMILCHPLMKTQVVRRTGLTTFEVVDFAFDLTPDESKLFQPYFKFAPDSLTLTASASTGSITLTASDDWFLADHVGVRFRMFQTEMTITAVTSPTEATATVHGRIRGRYGSNPMRTTNGSNVVEVTHVLHGLSSGASITLIGCNDVGGIAGTAINGTRTITVIDENTYSVVAGASATLSTDGGGPNVSYEITGVPVRGWDEAVFSPVNGYPAAVTFHDQRLWLGGSPERPQALWASTIARYFDFGIRDGTEADSIQITLGGEIAEIRHLLSNRHLQIFTRTNEFYAPQVEGFTLTPDMSVQRQTPYGASAVRPVPFDGATMFVQASQTAVREFLYDDGQRAYEAGSISLAASHLIKKPFDIAVLHGTRDRPEQYAFLLNEDGSLAVFMSARVEQLAGWAPWDICGGYQDTIKALCEIDNRLFVLTERAGSYWLELYGKEAGGLDGAVVLENATAQAAWALPARYANREVHVIELDDAGAPRLYLGHYEVGAGGELETETPAKKIAVGYEPVVAMRTLPPYVEDRRGSMLSEKTRIAEVIMTLDQTLSFTVRGQRLILRETNQDQSDAPGAFTGRQRYSLLGWSRDPGIEISRAVPMPMRILGLVQKVLV